MSTISTIKEEAKISPAAQLVQPEKAVEGQPLPSTGGNDLIRVEHLSKEFSSQDGPVEVLRDVSFVVPRGSFTIIYGPSGSGKSTLLNILLGLEPPSSGSVEIDGQDVYALDADERAIFRTRTLGMVYQTNYWVSSLSAIENIALPLYLTGRTAEEASGEAQASLARVGMEAYAKYQPSVLSGGQQQRISMARATVISPTLLIADEPTGNLDTTNGDMIMQLLLQFQKDYSSTILLVTHNPDYLPLSTHRLYIKDGKLTEEKGEYKVAGAPASSPLTTNAEPATTKSRSTSPTDSTTADIKKASLADKTESAKSHAPASLVTDIVAAPSPKTGVTKTSPESTEEPKQ